MNMKIDGVVAYILSCKSGFTLFTPNVDHFVRIQKNPSLFRLYSKSIICLNDSRVLSFLVRLFFNSKLNAVTGSDLISRLIDIYYFQNKEVLVVGLEPNYFDLFKTKYSSNFSRNLYHLNPPMGFINSDIEVGKLVQQIRDYNCPHVLLCVGSPQQELVADILFTSDSSLKIFCIGASLDYLVGKETRAPKFIQAMYLEWLFRFAQSPIKRFKRYFINCPQIIYYLLKERFLTKKL